MKKYLLLSAVLSSVLLPAAAFCVSRSAMMTPNMDQLRKEFQTPPPGYGPIPFWFWNGDMRAEELRRQVREMKDKGVSGAFIHARHGQITPYLSDEWFRLVRETVEESEKVGFQAWLYDEDNWPSGSAGKRVTEGRPDLYARYLKGIITDKPKEAVQVKIPRVNGKLLAVIAYPAVEDGLQLDPNQAMNLTDDTASAWIPDSESLSLPQLSSEKAWKVFLFWEMTDGYIDVMNPEAVQRFIDITHEAYAREVGKYFGTTIPGIFADECCLISIWDVTDKEAIPWSPRLAGEFEKRRGYSLLLKLPMLLDNIGPETTRVRQDYWQTVSELYTESFAHPIARWCEEHKIAFTGHVLSEEPLKPQVRIQANVIPFYREMHIPGVDNLTVKIGGLHHKLAASVCRQMGKERCLSETFGAVGWGAPLSARKPCVDWQLTQGINLFCPHASYYTVYGKRKRENPPSEFVQEPYWLYYKGFADYIARLSYMLTRGKPVVPVAVVYPIRSAWAHFQPDGQDPLLELVEKDLFYICDLLQKFHYDFDFISEDSLISAEIKDSKLHVGESTYEMLVLPSITTLERRGWMKSVEFFEQGGKVVALGLLPKESERGEDDVLAMATAREGMVDLESIYRSYLFAGMMEGINAPAFPTTKSNLAGGRISSFQPRLVMEQAEGLTRVHRLLRESLVPDVETRSEEILHHHRRFGDADIYFFANITDKPVHANIRVSAEGQPELWEPETGRIEPVLQYSVLEGEGIVLTLDFGPHESRLIVISGQIEPHVDSSNFKITNLKLNGDQAEVTGWARKAGLLSAVVEAGGDRFQLVGIAPEPPEPVALPDRWNFNRLHPNTVVLPDWRFARGDFSPGSTDEPSWEPLPKRQGIPWHPELEPLEIERPDFVTYVTGSHVEKVPDKASLVLEPIQAPVRVYVNRQEVELVRTGVLDPEFLEADITALLLEGINQVLVVADYRYAVCPEPSNLHRITCDLVPEPARVLGSFALRNSGDDLILVSEPDTLGPGSWTEQGYPHYSGTMDYRCEFTLPQSMADCRLVLDIESPANLVELSVNGKLIGTRLWEPFAFDITSAAVPGINRMSLKIANTAVNALLGKPSPSGLINTPVINACPEVSLTERGEINWMELLKQPDTEGESEDE